MASPPYWSPSPPPLAPGDAVANSIWRASIGRAVGTINCLTNFSTKLISFALSTEHEQRPHHWAVTKGVRRAPPPPHGGGGGWVGKFVVIAIQDVSSTLPSDRERDVTRPAGEWRRVRSSGCNYNWLSVYGSVGHCSIQARALVTAPSRLVRWIHHQPCHVVVLWRNQYRCLMQGHRHSNVSVKRVVY